MGGEQVTVALVADAAGGVRRPEHPRHRPGSDIGHSG